MSGRKNLQIGILIVALLATLVPGTVRADSGPVYFSVGVPVPTTSDTIRMVRETLAIDYTGQTPSKDSGGRALVGVHACFWFRNEGKAVTQQMGFPLGREILSGFGYYDFGFAVTADGTPVKTAGFTDRKAENSTGLTSTMWSTFQIPFAAGQTRIIDVHYRICPRGGYFLYVLQTGRLWKGPIGDLSIDVNFGRTPAFPDLLSVQPAGYHVQGNHLLWHFTNDEPGQDIEIESMDPAFWRAVRPLKEAAERTGTAAAWYRYALALLPDSIISGYGSTKTIAGVSVPTDFVAGLQSSVYADYVQRTLLTALNHCAHDSIQERVLDAAYDAHFSHNRTTGDFLRGVDIWDSQAPSCRAHDIAGQLSGAMNGARPSADETRLLAWLEVNMAGESMVDGYTLSGVHELEQAQNYAARAGLLKNTDYQSLFRTAAEALIPGSRPQLLVNVASVPRIEVQQQKMSLAGGDAWRARIILHFSLPPADAKNVSDFDNVTSQPDWKKLPDVSKDGSIPGYDNLDCGFSDTNNGDYLVILTLHGFRTAAEFQKAWTSVISDGGDNLLLNDVPPYAAYSYAYPTDTARTASLQSASYTWLTGVSPAVSFDPNHGVTVAQDAIASLANSLCDKADAELKPIVTFFGRFSWAKDDQIDRLLQENLDAVKETRGKTPSLTTVTYAADGTVQSTSNGDRAAAGRNMVIAALYIILGLAIGLLLGLFLPRRETTESTQKAA